MDVLKLMIILLLGLIFIEDMRFRAVRWYYFVVLFVFFSIQFYYQEGQIVHVAINLAFIIIQLAIATLYLFLKRLKLSEICQHIGLGDIITWIILTLLFSPINYIIFFILSTLCSLILYFLFKKPESKLIPLAGLQSLFILVIYGVQLAGVELNLYSDYWITKLVYGN